MPNIFDDPEVKAAMAAAGVVHQPGVAQEVLRDLAPFLAEEGIDLNDLGDTSLDSVNAALARASERYNQGLADVSHLHPRPHSGDAAGTSPFIRRAADRGSGQGVRESASRPSHGSPARRASRRAAAASDRALVREFERWLRRQDEIAAPTPSEESGVLAELLRAARHHGFDPSAAGGVEELAILFLDDDAAEEGLIEAIIRTLHDYVHFQMDTGGDPGAWEDVHDLVADALDNPLPGGHILEAAIDEAEQLPPDERRDALARTLLVARVAELLAWIGTGRKVAPSGGVQRADIAYAAGLLGIDAIGVNKLPPLAPDSPAIFDLDGESTAAIAIRARSMKDVPLLPSWWTALDVVELIHVNGTRVVSGPSATRWMADSLPPLELAEAVVGVTLTEAICEDLARRSAPFAGDVASMTVVRLLRALAPDAVDVPTEGNAFERLLHSRTTRDLRRLEHVGILNARDEDDFVVPRALRGTVARGLLTTLAVLSGASADD